jgi:hypothetical protein
MVGIRGPSKRGWLDGEYNSGRIMRIRGAQELKYSSFAI